MTKKETILHWADQTAKRIIAEKGDKKKYVIAAGITPSGTIHVGNFREMITVDFVNRALKDLGKDVKFIYSWDDYDTFRKVPVNMPDKDYLKTFLRMPITDVPDTAGCKHKSYAEHNEKAVEEALPILGIKPKFICQNKKYKNCDYAEEIKTALQKTDEIKKILNEFRKEPLKKDWYPVSVFCEKCKKDTAKIKKYDGEYNIIYKCDCGFESAFDIRKKGIIKLLWRIDWPMRWHYEKVDFESGGKDHFAAGGSFDTAKKVSTKVYNYLPPTSMRYEWIAIKGGKQFASSEGVVITLQELLQIYEPEIIRYMFAGTRPEAEFEISFDIDVIKIYEDFDKCERICYKSQEQSSLDSQELRSCEKEKTDEKEQEKQKRIYELSCVSKPFKKMPLQIPFRHLTNFVQVYEGDINKVLKELDIKKEDKEKVRARAERALNWVNLYAPEEFKFKVQEKVAVKVTEKEAKALHLIAKKLKTQKFDEKSLYEKFYEISKELDLNSKDFFKAAYGVLLNKEKGPRLAPFVLLLKDRAIKLFEQA